MIIIMSQNAHICLELGIKSGTLPEKQQCKMMKIVLIR